MRMERKILLALTVLAILTNFIEAAEDARVVMEKTQPAYALARAADTIPSPGCREDLRVFRSAVDHRILWSLRVLDSSGRPENGFLDGNIYWLGSKYQCLDTMSRVPLPVSEAILKNNTRFRNPDEEYPPFEIAYSVAYVRHNSTMQYQTTWQNEDIIVLGLCLPASCSTDDISDALQEIFHNRTLLIRDLYAADFKLVEVKDLQDDYQWLFSGNIIAILCSLAGLFIIMTIGTLYDLILQRRQSQLAGKCQIYENNNTTSGEIVLCFSIYSNTIRIMDTKLGGRSIPCIHGMRFFSMYWIIMAHMVFFTVDFTDNRAWLAKVTGTFITQLMQNAAFAVDTFFMLSGFVLAYMYWVEAPPRKSKTKVSKAVTQYIMMLIKRYLRLTPTYMLVVGIYLLNMTYYSKSGIFRTPYELDVCVKYWWRNILYINNFYDTKSMCMLWSWYLAADMQFFILTTFLLILSSMYFVTSACIFAILSVGTLIVPAYIGYAWSYVHTFDMQVTLMNVMYTPPWMRYGPYAVGVGLAWVLIKYKDLKLSRRALCIGWSLSLTCNLLILLAFHGSQSLLGSILYVSLGRIGWGISVAWVIFVCATGQANLVNKILSFKGLLPLSRLTYAAYLLNPFLLHSVFLASESVLHFGVLFHGLMSFGLVLGSFLAAYVVCLMVEMPSTRLMHVFSARPPCVEK